MYIIIPMQTYAYFNNKIVPLAKVRINPYDLGFLRGYGVFDFMVTANGKPFMPDDHWKRLELSAKELGLGIPMDRKKYDQIVQKLISLHKYERRIVRTIITGGISSDGVTPSGKETCLILIEKAVSLPEKIYKNGAKVITVEYLRDCPRAKINNYVTAIKNIKNKKRNGALEILYTYNGKVLEASTSNFFIIKNGALVTPHENILHGITRKVILMLARKKRYKVIEREVSEKEIYSADEAFLTASNKFVVPVVKINSQKIGDGKVGKHTKVLMEEFAKFINKY